MSQPKKYPSISVIIPTLNAAKVLPACLRSIRLQIYPLTKIEILIIDGGSTDDTLKIAKRYKCQVLSNPLKTAEAGKAVGVKYSQSDYLALIDSDNILPSRFYFRRLISPLEKHFDAIGSEPWSYTYRPHAGLVERYSALTGVNDPYALVIGIYDRKNYLRRSWTSLHFPIQNFADYQIATFLPNSNLPTIGANGTVFRRSAFKDFAADYFFDIDIISDILQQSAKPITFIKVKVGIIHTFCEGSISKFYRKQLRRVKDLYSFRHIRAVDRQQRHQLDQVLFTLYVVLIIPMVYDTFVGYIRKPDPAWFFHPLACIITLYTYAIVTLQKLFGINIVQNRQKWSQ